MVCGFLPSYALSLFCSSICNSYLDPNFHLWHFELKTGTAVVPMLGNNYINFVFLCIFVFELDTCERQTRGWSE